VHTSELLSAGEEARVSEEREEGEQGKSREWAREEELEVGEAEEREVGEGGTRTHPLSCRQ